MKKNLSVLIASLVLMFVSSQALAQDAKKKVESPAATATAKIGAAKVNISYGQPSVKGRKIWGDLVPYGKVWRTGANTATVFETDKDVKIEGKVLKAGKYALFTIPTEKEWTIIFNKKSDQWGSYNYSEKDDALRVSVKAEASKDMVERMTFDIKDSKVKLTWEKLAVGFKVE